MMVLGLTIISYLSSGSFAKSFTVALVGLLIGTIGIDIFRGLPFYLWHSRSL